MGEFNLIICEMITFVRNIFTTTVDAKVGRKFYDSRCNKLGQKVRRAQRFMANKLTTEFDFDRRPQDNLHPSSPLTFAVPSAEPSGRILQFRHSGVVEKFRKRFFITHGFFSNCYP
jgi:hypothetical protein